MSKRALRAAWIRTALILLCLITLPFLASPVGAESTADFKIGIYYQDAGVSSTAFAVADALKASGFNVTVSKSGMRQLPAWTNSVRCFHSNDFLEAQQVRKLATDAASSLGALKVLDLSPAFTGTKVRAGWMEIWLCDEVRNKALPEAPYERHMLAWTLAQTPTPEAVEAPAPESPSGDAWDDQWCLDWPLPRRVALLNRLPGKSYKSPDGRTEWKVYEAPAIHGHGAPEGSCGLRVRTYRNGQVSGEWQDLELSRLFTLVPGNEHCLLVASGENEQMASLILDATGKVLWKTQKHLMTDPSVWLSQPSEERLWIFDEGKLMQLRADGNTIWRAKEKASFYGCFFSEDSQHAFLLEDAPLTKDPNRPGRFTWHNGSGVIYSQDGSSSGPFALPFADIKGQKSLLGLTNRGDLILRVDRKIYSYHPGGQARLEAALPHYPGRHPDVEEERPGYNFDVGYDYGRSHAFKFETVVQRPSDHPRPMVRFDIETWVAEESLDEGSRWHPLDITSTAAAETK